MRRMLAFAHPASPFANKHYAPLQPIGIPLKALHDALAEAGFPAFAPAFALVKPRREIGQGRPEFSDLAALRMRILAAALHGRHMFFEQRRVHIDRRHPAVPGTGGQPGAQVRARMVGRGIDDITAGARGGHLMAAGAELIGAIDGLGRHLKYIVAVKEIPEGFAHR